MLIASTPPLGGWKHSPAVAQFDNVAKQPQVVTLLAYSRIHLARVWRRRNDGSAILINHERRDGDQLSMTPRIVTHVDHSGSSCQRPSGNVENDQQRRYDSRPEPTSRKSPCGHGDIVHQRPAPANRTRETVGRTGNSSPVLTTPVAGNRTSWRTGTTD